MSTNIKAIKIVAIAILGILFSNNIASQGINDLGLVWQHEYGEGNILDIQPNRDGSGYIAAGYGTSQEGLIIEFDESGKEIRKVKTNMNTIYAARANDASATFRVAFKTDDGGILAFGDIRDPGAPQEEMMVQWTKGLLLKGIWIVKYDKDLNIDWNERVMGTLIYTGVQASDGSLIVGGMDRNESESTNINDLKLISLLRKYDQEGKIITDSRDSYRELKVIRRVPNSSNLVAASQDQILTISNNSSLDLTITSATFLGDLNLPDLVNPSLKTMSLAQDGGIFIQTQYETGNPHELFDHGEGTYRLEANSYKHSYSKISIPSKTQYSAPLLLHGNDNPRKYIGTLSKRDSWSQTPVTYMYELTDNEDEDDDNKTFDYREGVEYAAGTSLKASSTASGFFSAGQDAVTKNAVIVKYSPCASFKINNLPTNNEILLPFTPNININIPINFEGAEAANQSGVTYSLMAVVEKGTVNGKTEGEILEDLIDQPVSTFAGGSGMAFNLNRNYTLTGGGATIKYILSIKDSYLVGTLPQSCEQHYVFYLKSLPQADVVAMPSVTKDTSGALKVRGSIKNIGYGVFNNPFQITIYKDNVGNAAIKHVYSYPNTIAQNETVDFDIDLPTSADWTGATKIIVNFNDNGNGNRNQTEYDETVERDYEIDL